MQGKDNNTMQDKVFSLILVPKAFGTPRFLPLYFSNIFLSRISAKKIRSKTLSRIAARYQKNRHSGLAGIFPRFTTFLCKEHYSEGFPISGNDRRTKISTLKQSFGDFFLLLQGTNYGIYETV
jgi:hypothetical protein